MPETVEHAAKMAENKFCKNKRPAQVVCEISKKKLVFLSSVTVKKKLFFILICHCAVIFLSAKKQ